MSSSVIIGILCIVLGLVGSYLVGGIPDGVLVGKAFGGIDVRKHGSGNIGTTNSLRLGGWKMGLLTCACDILKGVVGTLIVYFVIMALANAGGELGEFGAQLSSGWEYELAMGLAMFITVVGHVYSPYLHFKGGKGIATSFGGFLVVCPWCALTSIIAFLSLSAITKHVSVGSLAGALAYLATTLIVYSYSVPLVIVAIMINALVFWAHRANIKRLVRHEESVFSVGSKKTMEEARKEEIEEQEEETK